MAFTKVGSGAVSLMLAFACAAVLHAQNQTVNQPPKYPEQGPTYQVVTPSKTEPPPVKIEPEVLELGDLPPDTKVNGEFKLTNTGNEALRIRAAMSTCSCTVTQLTETLIEPGRAIILPVTFDSGKVLAAQDREVIIRYMGYSKSSVARVRANTNYGVRTTVEFTPPEQRRMGVVTLESVDGTPFRVFSADGKPADLLLGEAGVPGTRFEVKWDLSEYAPERLPRWFIIETDHPTSPMIDLGVENLEWEPERTLRPWYFSEQRVILGRMPPMAQKEIVVTAALIQSGGLDFVRSVWVEPEIAHAEIMGMEQSEDGLKIRVRVTPNADQRGPFVAKVMVSGFEYEDGVTVMGRIADPAHAEE